MRSQHIWPGGSAIIPDATTNYQLWCIIKDRATFSLDTDSTYDGEPARSSGRKHGLRAGSARLLANVAEWQRRRAVMQEMAMMTDRELSDIGLSRADLATVFDPTFAANRARGRGLHCLLTEVDHSVSGGGTCNAFRPFAPIGCRRMRVVHGPSWRPASNLSPQRRWAARTLRAWFCSSPARMTVAPGARFSASWRAMRHSGRARMLASTRS